MDPSEKQLLKTWQLNAAPWIETLEKGDITSRPTTTNLAITQACTKLNPQNGLDLGCGEGWLCRSLAETGIQMTGIDGVDGLIRQAQKHGEEEYRVIAYEHILEGKTDQLNLPYDLVVCNFSLFGKKLTEALSKAVFSLVSDSGHWVIQTLHPDYPLETNDGWVNEDWSGMKRNFQAGYSWYRWTKSGWRNLLEDAGFKAVKFTDVQEKGAAFPLSLIIEAGK